MPLLISDIISVTGPVIIREMNHDYHISEPALAWDTNEYFVYITDIRSGLFATVRWNLGDELRNQTENRKIAFVKTLIENAVRQLARHEGTPLTPTPVAANADDAVEDVKFDL